MSTFLKRHENHFILVFGVLLSLGLRYALVGYVSPDYRGFLSKWYDFIVQHGIPDAFAHDFANYNPPYLYMMAVAVYVFPFLPKIVAIKSISIVFDLVVAWFVYKLVELKYQRSIAAVFSCLAVLFAPTVFLNSACWGQADSIYTAFLVACLYWICSNKHWWALASFGFAFAVKAQAIFFAPFLLTLFLKRQLSWKPFLLVPIIYFSMLVPSWLAGRNFVDLLFTYMRQSASYHQLSKNAPNFFEWFPDEAYAYLYPAGLILGVSVAFLLIVGIYKSSRKIDRDLLIEMAFVFVLIVPYFLPKMHERYFYPADILAIVYAFYFPKYFFVPIAVITCSFFAYLPYLFGVSVPIAVLSLVLGIVVIVVAHHLIKVLKQNDAGM